MRTFISRHLDPGSRLGEVLFGLIMALGFTASVRLGLDDPDNRQLFRDILGCNLAWAIIDGAMYTMLEFFERGRMARLLREVAAVQSDAEAVDRLAVEFDERMGFETTPEDRKLLEGWLLAVARRGQVVRLRVHREDVLGGLAAGLLVLGATLPMLVPFLVLSDPAVAVRASNSIAVFELFLLGVRWGQEVGGSPWRTGAALTIAGLALVLVTIALGG